MRTLLGVICVALLTPITIAVSLTAAAAGAEPECWQYVQIQEYFNTIYVAPPAQGTSFVFLQGQPIRLRVLVANEGDQPQIVRPQDGPVSPAVLTSASKGGCSVICFEATRRSSAAASMTRTPRTQSASRFYDREQTICSWHMPRSTSGRN